MSTDTSIPNLLGDRRTGANTGPQDVEISLLDILIVLAERKRIIFRVTAAFAVIAAIVALILPKRYTATVTILTPQQNSSLSAVLGSQAGSLGGMAALAGGGLSFKSPNEVYVSMLTSRSVEDAMIQRFGLMQEYKEKLLSDTRRAFESHATVDGSGKDGLIRISLYDRDPNRAAELANGYVDQFRKLSERLAITEASQRRLFYQQQLEEAKNNLADAEQALKRTEQQTGVIQLDSQARALIETASSLRAQIAAKQVQIEAVQNFATKDNAQLIQLQTELQALNGQLLKLQNAEPAKTSDLNVSQGKVTEAGIEYVRRLRDVKYYETIFDILARQFELAKLDEAKQGAVIQVVDSAVPPDKRSFPKRTLIVIGATFIGAIIGIGLSLILWTRERITADSEANAKFEYLKSLLWPKISLRREASRP